MIFETFEKNLDVNMHSVVSVRVHEGLSVITPPCAAGVVFAGFRSHLVAVSRPGARRAINGAYVLFFQTVFQANHSIPAT